MAGLGYQQAKPTADFCLALVLLIVACPIILLSLILVRLTSRGPAIYSQKRLGFRGRLITIYKIRTMYANCERDTGAVWSLPGDPRITPVGRFLRWSHLDELPQLFNIVSGDMSLIGPRPERPEIIAKLEKSLPDYRQRLEVRPGLTGLAQVLQAPDTDLGCVRRKLDLDLHYIRQMGPWMDFRIVLATPLHVVNFPDHRIARIFGFPTDTLQPPVPWTSSEVGTEGSQVTPKYAG